MTNVVNMSTPSNQPKQLVCRRRMCVLCAVCCVLRAACCVLCAVWVVDRPMSFTLHPPFLPGSLNTAQIEPIGITPLPPPSFPSPWPPPSCIRGGEQLCPCWPLLLLSLLCIAWFAVRSSL